MRSLVTCVVAAGVLLAGGCSAADDREGGSGAASCEAPVVTVEPGTVEPGGTVRVTALWLFDGCDDTGLHTSAPLVGLPLVLTDASGASTTVATLDADAEDGGVDAEVVVPADAAHGVATVRLGSLPPADLVVGR